MTETTEHEAKTIATLLAVTRRRPNQLSAIQHRLYLGFTVKGEFMADVVLSIIVLSITAAIVFLAL